MSSSDFIESYRVGLVLSLEGTGSKSKGGKALKVCKVDIGYDDPITIVTSASNVREGSRIVVAPLGSSYLDKEGFEVTVEKAMIGGCQSEGMFCDSKMLGWTSGGRGIAAILPYTYEIGSVPPSSKPRPPKESESDEEEKKPKEPEGLYEKKLSKEEKKKLAEERRRARKAAKAAKSRGSDPAANSSGDGDDDHDSP